MGAETRIVKAIKQNLKVVRLKLSY